jgi:hypothetical protein
VGRSGVKNGQPGPSWAEGATQDLFATEDDTGSTADLTVASADELTKVKQILLEAS